MYEIRFSRSVRDDLARLRARDRTWILDAIDAQLTHQPDVVTKSRKVLTAIMPPWDAVPPLWQLRVGEYRVFYDVDTHDECVYVRAVRRKPPHATTEEIL